MFDTVIKYTCVSFMKTLFFVQWKHVDDNYSQKSLFSLMKV